MRAIRTSAVALAAVLAGCAAPVVTIRHTLPAAVPVVAYLGQLRPGEFSVQGQAGEDLASTMTKALRERIPEVPAPADGIVSVGGTIRAQTADTRGTRQVRHGNPAGGPLEPRAVPTLVRTATVAVDFVLTGEAALPVTIETSSSYNSAADPRVRGELGLGRADDPENVPPAGQVLGELLGECVDMFLGMVKPIKVVERVQLRPALSRAGAAGLAAAKAGDFATAAANFRAALAKAPADTLLLFNLAVTEEAAGRLHEALKHYRSVVEQTKGRDAPAAEGERRVSGILPRLGAARLGG